MTETGPSNNPTPPAAAGVAERADASASEELVSRWRRRPARRVLAALAVILVAAAVGSTWLAVNQLAPVDPIAEAAQAFAGHPRQADIRSRLNIAFAAGYSAFGLRIFPN